MKIVAIATSYIEEFITITDMVILHITRYYYSLIPTEMLILSLGDKKFNMYMSQSRV